MDLILPPIGQAHDMFSRISRIRIYDFFHQLLCDNMFWFSQMLITEKKMSFFEQKEIFLLFQLKKFVGSYSKNSWKHVVSSILVFNIHSSFIQSKSLWRSKSILLTLWILVKTLPCWNWSKTCSWMIKQVILRLHICHRLFKLKPGITTKGSLRSIHLHYLEV